MDLLKRILCLILLSTLLLSVAAGCGKNGKDEQTSEGFMTSSVDSGDSALSFDGEGNEVRLYNITVAGEETNNLRLSGDMKYLSASELSEEDAGNAMKYDGIKGYKFSPDNSAWRSGDTVTIAEDGTTVITLRFIGQ